MEVPLKNINSYFDSDLICIMFPIFHDHSSDNEIEGAINFLVENIIATGNNPKPVILHSIRVGMSLLKLNYPKNVIIAGILHDIIEDSSVTSKNVAEKFGSQIADLVLGNSFNKNIENLEDRYKDLFSRCFLQGRSAAIIKAADIYDNLSFFIYAAKNFENGMDNYNYLLSKGKYFAFLAKDVIGSEPIYKMMVERLNYYGQLSNR